MSAWIEVTLAITRSKVLVAVSDIVMVYDYTSEVAEVDENPTELGVRSLICLRSSFETSTNRLGVITPYEVVCQRIRD